MIGAGFGLVFGVILAIIFIALVLDALHNIAMKSLEFKLGLICLVVTVMAFAVAYCRG